MSNPDLNPGLPGLRILVVEDDPSARWALCTLMKKLGYNCQTACDGEDALRMVESFVPQVILMDLMIPGLDGLETTRRLKADARTQKIPILALTGMVSEMIEATAREAGCDDFLSKPIVLNDLLTRVHASVGV